VKERDPEPPFEPMPKSHRSKRYNAGKTKNDDGGGSGTFAHPAKSGRRTRNRERSRLAKLAKKTRRLL
jgi:hypothetical protein